MQIGRINGATRVLGKRQGYLGLPVKDGTINDSVTGPNTPCMTTAWLPTPKEIDALLRGAPIHVRIMGVSHPPIMVEVGDPPDDVGAIVPEVEVRRQATELFRQGKDVAAWTLLSSWFLRHREGRDA